jgi:integrase
VSIVRTLQRIKGQALMVGQPKTNRSKRPIKLSPEAVKLFHEIRGKQLAQQSMYAEVWNSTGYVFTQPDGLPIDPDLLSKAFLKLIKASGLPHMTLHGLRHIHATLLLEAGVHQKIVAERLGHANIATTMDVYSHVLPDLQDVAALAIDAKLYGK